MFFRCCCSNAHQLPGRLEKKKGVREKKSSCKWVCSRCSKQKTNKKKGEGIRGIKRYQFFFLAFQRTYRFPNFYPKSCNDARQCWKRGKKLKEARRGEEERVETGCQKDKRSVRRYVCECTSSLLSLSLCPCLGDERSQKRTQRRGVRLGPLLTGAAPSSLHSTRYPPAAPTPPPPPPPSPPPAWRAHGAQSGSSECAQ